jgi:tRNA (guanine37-N1)-methyltransferase
MRKYNLKKQLQEKVSEEELKLMHVSFDIAGSRNKAVAIVDIPKELKSKEKLIAETIMKMNNNVKSVLKKLSERKGEYRLYDFELIVGDTDTEVIHKEHGYTIKLDPQKVFFSPREMTERQRIASQVKPNENVLIMFSGVCPYAICICKKQPLVNKVYGIEINPDAHNYALENVRVNKISHKVILINGDVKEVCPNLKIKFDRIVMPLAREAYKYLDVAIPLLKENGILHFYYIGPENDLFSEAEEIIRNATEKFDKKIEIINKKKVLPFGSRSWKICLDVLFY